MLVHHFVKISPNHLVHYIFYHNKETLTIGGASLRYKQYPIFAMDFFAIVYISLKTVNNQLDIWHLSSSI